MVASIESCTLPPDPIQFHGQHVVDKLDHCIKISTIIHCCSILCLSINPQPAHLQGSTRVSVSISTWWVHAECHALLISKTGIILGR